MTLNRREFLHFTAGSMIAGSSITSLGPAIIERAPYKAIAFDGFAIFDPRPVFALAESLFPGKGGVLSNAWRTRQFEYQWLRASAGQYADFMQTTDDALKFAAKTLQLELNPDRRAQLLGAYLHLDAWPDVGSALTAMRDAGVRLALLSNMTASMLESGISNARLTGMFEHVLSTDRIRTYKPDARAYRMGVNAFRLRREEIVFAAFADWDAAGAKWFGYPTVWINRADAPAEELGVVPDATGRDMSTLMSFVNASR
jgi:2-haloacid dehalogenase